MHEIRECLIATVMGLQKEKWSAEAASVGAVPVTYLQGEAAGVHQIGHGDCAAAADPQAGEHQHCSHVQLSI